MQEIGGRRLWCGALVAAIAVCAGLAAAAGRIDRIDIFDRSDNHLMFVTFDYDDAGNNTGRSVYMSDSTFVRSTVFETDGQGRRTKENSINFNGWPVGHTAFVTDAGRRGILVYDEFGLDLLGGVVSVAATDRNNYDIYQNGAVINKMRYTCDDQGSLSRIDVMDKSGKQQLYATVAAAITATGPQGLPSVPGRPVLRPAGNSRCILAAALKNPSRICARLYSVDGRCLKTIVEKTFGAGNVRVPLDIASPGIAAGVHVVCVLINGNEVLHERLVSMRFSGGAR